MGDANDFDIDDLMNELNLEDELAEQMRRDEEMMLQAELAELEADPGLASELAERRAAEALKKSIEENKRRAAEKRQQYVLLFLSGLFCTCF